MKKYTLTNYVETTTTASSSTSDSGIIDSGIVDSGLIDSGLVDPDDEENTIEEFAWDYGTYTEEEMEQMMKDGIWRGGWVNNIYVIPDVNVYGSGGSGNGRPGNSGTGSGGSGTGSSGNSGAGNGGSGSSGPSNSGAGNSGGGEGGSAEGGSTSGNGSSTNGGNSGGGGNNHALSENHYPQGPGTFSAKYYGFGAFPNGGASVSFSYGGSYRIEGRTMSISAYVTLTAHREYTYTGGIIVTKDGKQVIFQPLSPLMGDYIIDPNYIYIGNCSIKLPYDGKVEVHFIVGAINSTEEGRGAVNDHTVIYRNY